MKPAVKEEKFQVLDWLDVLYYLDDKERTTLGIKVHQRGVSDGYEGVKAVLWGEACDSHLGSFGNDRYYFYQIPEDRAGTWEEESKFWYEQQAKAESAWSKEYYSDASIAKRKRVYDCEGMLLKEFGDSFVTESELGQGFMFWVCW